MARMAVWLPIPSVCAEERSGQRIRARDCLSEASSSETPLDASTAGCPVAKRRGRRQWGRLLLPSFLGDARKEGAPPGALPGSRPWQRHAAKRLATNQITMNSIASSTYPISARAQLNPQPPTAPCGTWFRSNHRVSRAASVSGWRDSSVASTRSAMSARFMPCSSTRATSS